MSFRNLSPQEMFCKMALNHTPSYSFQGNSKADFEQWKAKAYPEVLATLGDFPKKVPLNPQLMVEWEEDGLIKQRWLIDVGEYISATFLCNKPKDIKTGEKLPAILCCHGHGDFGKDPVMSSDSNDLLQEAIKQMNYNYGHKMAKAGFVTFAIDWIGFGERSDKRKPNFRVNKDDSRDLCNLYYLNATMLGMSSLSINISHGKAATDFACTFDEVDPERLGVMGLSGGGTMSLWMAYCDERFKAVEIICYSDLWAYFGVRDLNYCGMQVAPGLYKLVDLPDLQGLLAPCPLLIDIGIYDECFKVDTAMTCFNKVKSIYQVAGVTEKLEIDLHPGPHVWGENKSVEFFSKYL